MARSTTTSVESSTQDTPDDSPAALQWSEVALVGREQQAATITAVIDECGGYSAHSQAIMLRGTSGTGKSTLAMACMPETALVGYGKCEQGFNNPYSCVVTAVSAILFTLMSENIDCDRFKSRLQSSFLSDEMRALAKVIPMLNTLIVGELSAPKASGIHTEGSALQLRSLFRRLLSLLGSCSKPVIFVIDDLQWADDASRELIDAILKDTTIPNFVFIGIVRTGEDTTFEPPTGEDVMKVTTLQLGSWNVNQVQELLFLVLEGIERESIGELADILYRRTEGNPFSVKQYLDIMVDRKLLRFDPINEKHVWDAEQVMRELPPTETVMDLTVEKLSTLPLPALVTVSVGSCLGHSFDAGTLESLVMSTDLLSVFQLEDKSLTQVDLLSIDARTLQKALKRAKSMGLLDAKVVNGNTIYSFTHDRIQQAAQSMIAQGQVKSEIMATIGTLLLELGEANKKESWMMTSATRLLLANASEVKEVSRRRLIELGLEAAKLSANMTAYADAAWFTDSAIELLKENGWSKPTYDLCLELHNLSAETHRSAVHMPMTIKRVKAIQKHGLCPEDKFRAYNVMVDTFLAEKKFKHCVSEVNQAINALGFGPKNPGLFDAIRTVFQVKRMLKGRSASDLRMLHAYSDRADVTQAMNLLFSAGIAAWSLSEITTSIASAFKPFALTLKHGVGPLSPFAFACFAAIQAHQGKLIEAYTFGELTLQTLQRQDVTFERECVAKGTALVSVLHIVDPICEIVDGLDKAAVVGEENGEYSDACMTSYHATASASFGSTPLALLQSQTSLRMRTAKDFKQEGWHELLAVYNRFAAAMLREGEEPENPFANPNAYENNPSGIRLMLDTHVVRLIILFLKGEHEQAALEQKCFSKKDAAKNELMYKVYFYRFLVVLNALVLNKNVKSVRKQYKAFQKYAACGSPHGRGLFALIQAEEQKNANEAVEFYKQAIDLLKEAKLGLWEAVTYERLAKVLQVLGHGDAANQSLKEAYQKYNSYNVNIKTVAMKQLYPGLLRNM